MKKLPLIYFKLFALLLFTGLQIFAGDNRSGYVSYTHTSGNTYHFKIFTYTDPTEVGADRCEETLIFNNISSGTPFYLTCTRTNTTSGVDLMALNLANCGGNGNVLGQGLMQVYPFTRNCSNSIVNNYGGVKLNIYEGDYTFNGNGTYILGVVNPNLPPDINNINMSQNAAFALEDTLRITNLLPYNNSPIASTSLVDSVSIGQNFSYNLNLTDADNDSLSYSFVPFITGDTTGNFYAVPSSYVPFGMSIDAITGNLSWQTTLGVNCNYGAYDLDILVKEYRRVSGLMTLIGSEIFSIQINAICNTALGINKLAISDNQINVYPNPANDQSVINISLTRSQQVSLRLYDMQGTLIKTIVKEKVTEGQNQYQVSLSDVAEGTYFYRLITEDSICEKKLIVIKD